MKHILIFACTLSLIGHGTMLASCSQAHAAGPSGGDVVSIQDGTAKAELITNADTGEVMVHTWDPKLQSPQPVDAVPMTVGSGNLSVDLAPHPLATDPPGRCSRFYGQADWLRGGSIDRGWLRCCGAQGNRQDMAWKSSWSGGHMQGGMWTGMGEHRRGPMGREMGMHH